MRMILSISAVFICVSAASAQDAPSLDVLQSIVRQLGGRGAPVPKKIEFSPAPGDSSPACGLAPFEMTLSQGSRARRYSVLLDREGAARSAPRQIFASINRLMVDADGAARAYHPEDPDGEGSCQIAGDGRHLRGVCALDRFSSGQIHLFRGGEKLKKATLATAWKDIWPRIRDRALKSFALSDLAGPNAPAHYHLFHWRDKNLTALFRRSIIPLTHDGYPCLHGAESRFPGYFVAATTLTKGGAARADGCAPARYIDAEDVPFFVLPGGTIGSAGIGDIVIARLKRNGSERFAYGIVADAGPITNFGEASIAFNQALLGRAGDLVMNVREVEALDIEGGPINVLILGGTKELLKGDYSRSNIENVARREFVRWGGPNPGARIEACAVQARSGNNRS